MLNGVSFHAPARTRALLHRATSLENALSGVWAQLRSRVTTPTITAEWAFNRDGTTQQSQDSRDTWRCCWARRRGSPGQPSSAAQRVLLHKLRTRQHCPKNKNPLKFRTFWWTKTCQIQWSRALSEKAFIWIKLYHNDKMFCRKG